MISTKITDIFKALSNSIPNPKIELLYTNNYTLLIAVVLSARCKDSKVNEITKDLFNFIKTPQDMLSLGEKELVKKIQTIGLYNAKASNLINLSKILIEKFNSQVPDTQEELESLPGVGRKTANVILNTAFEKSVIAVDTHVFRVSNRTGIAKGKTVEEIENKLNQIIPDDLKRNAHHLLVLHGRYVCKAIKPLCNSCVISRFCDFYENISKL